MDGSKELLKKVGPVAKKAVRIGAVVAAVHTLNAGLDSQAQPVSSQVPPPPEGHHQELKGPMPSQLPITEQIKQVKALQGEEMTQNPEQAEIKTDILIFETAYDPINGVFWTIGRHPSKGDAMALYKGRYTEGKVLWQKITEFPWMGTLPGMVAVSPTEPNILTVAGGEQNQAGPGKILLSKDGGQNFQEITVPDMGAVNYVTFSKNGDKIYYSTNNFAATAGIVVKVDAASQTRVAAANNGLEKMQEFGGPILASPNNNDTLYAVSGIEPAILVTKDGGQNWEKLFYLPSPEDAITLVNWQDKDTLFISGNGWLKMWQEGGQLQHIFSDVIAPMAVDIDGSELKIYGGSGTNRLRTFEITSSTWREFSTTGLPTGKQMDDLKIVTTSDGRKWLIGRVLGTSNSVDSSGFWAYDLAQGETGSWQQMSDGLEWKDPWPFKVYLPSLTKQHSSGW